MPIRTDAVNQALKLPQGQELEARLQKLLSDERDLVKQMNVSSNYCSEKTD